MPDEAELPPGAELYWDAFWELSADRPQSGFGVHAIPFTAIDAYARRYAIADFATLVALVRVCDTEFVSIMSEKLKAKEVK